MCGDLVTHEVTTEDEHENVFQVFFGENSSPNFIRSLKYLPP